MSFTLNEVEAMDSMQKIGSAPKPSCSVATNVGSFLAMDLGRVSVIG
jgi:hypothetical protein